MMNWSSESLILIIFQDFAVLNVGPSFTQTPKLLLALYLILIIKFYFAKEQFNQGTVYGPCQQVLWKMEKP
jgi:hypothetical protein